MVFLTAGVSSVRWRKDPAGAREGAQMQALEFVA
ncbi:hypothetical protein EV648_12144 [Kribbella sp. VKM Ac-2568]|nr:hypothetical protein EV648_12144 [Kribbella sp. VKM Ac-2568]